MSMDTSGKIIWAKHSEVQQANLKAMGDAEIKDGERLPLAVKDMGSCEIYPQTIQHNPNGRCDSYLILQSYSEWSYYQPYTPRMILILTQYSVKGSHTDQIQ